MTVTFETFENSLSTESCKIELTAKEDAIELGIESTASELGFVNPEENQVFACAPTSEKDQYLTLNNRYDLSIIRRDTDKVLRSEDSSGLEVEAGSLDGISDFTVTCEAFDRSKNRKGSVSRHFTTVSDRFDFKFTVEPLTGVERDTEFHIKLTKQFDSLSECHLSYASDRDWLRLDTNQHFDFNFTNEGQEVHTNFVAGSGTVFNIEEFEVVV